MKPEPRQRAPLHLYVLAAPVYLLRDVLTLVRLFRLWRISRLGYIDCPHCGAENAIDILAQCPRCRTSEYGNLVVRAIGGCTTEGSHRLKDALQRLRPDDSLGTVAWRIRNTHSDPAQCSEVGAVAIF